MRNEPKKPMQKIPKSGVAAYGPLVQEGDLGVDRMGKPNMGGFAAPRPFWEVLGMK